MSDNIDLGLEGDAPPEPVPTPLDIEDLAFERLAAIRGDLPLASRGTKIAALPSH